MSATQRSIHAALPIPVLDLPFDEGSGLSAVNVGSLSGTAEFIQADDRPSFSTNVPTGPFAPVGNISSIDFGDIAAGQGGRAIDVFTGTDGTLGPLPAFTISGWLNPRNLAVGSGGNRLLFALETAGGAGVDIVQLNDGSLQLGVNQFPDNSPARSSAGRLRANAGAAATNWVYFAIVYDPQLSSQQVKFYFGNGQTPAALDSARNYTGANLGTEGRVDFTGTPTIGNFSGIISARTATGPGASRVFRGLMDELKVYNTALNLAEIQSDQASGATSVAPITIQQQPASRTIFEGQSATLTVVPSGSAPFNYQWQRNGINIPNATNEVYEIESATTADNGASFQVIVGNAAGTTNSQPAILTVLEETGQKVSLSFSEAGLFVQNRGNLGGSGRIVQSNGFPIVSPNVPAGAFTPGDNLSSIFFGAIAEGQGSRAIDFTNSFGNTMGPLEAFTISGWLNSVDLEDGDGGNRIAFALSAGNGPGFDLVQLADGSLQLGVNQWPDNTPARSSPVLTADPNGAQENWTFFAVTYDGTTDADNVQFYFGNAGQEAQLDVAPISYPRGPITTSGALTIGNFGSVVTARAATGPTASRVFRGFIDELNIFSKVLSLEEIQNQQKAAAYKPVQSEPVQFTKHPVSVMTLEGQDVSFTAEFSGTPPLTLQWQKDGVSIPGETNQLLIVAATLALDGAQYRLVVSNVVGAVPSQAAILSVKPNTGRKVAIHFNEGTGTTAKNAADLSGSGTFVLQNEFPKFSSNVPAGTLAPTNNPFAIDFGAIGDGEGNRAIDFTNAFGNTLGSFDQFTVTGWLNSRDLRVGSGGNRITFALAAANGPGFDLVQLADGSLQLGVNQWPDNTPARSSPGLIPEDPEAGPGNWVFFAVTYDGLAEFGNVQFFSGNAETPAQLDVAPLDYNRGPIVQSGALTVGNFGPAIAARTSTGPAASRVFRGLIDEINVYSKVLSVDEIQAAQKASTTAGPSSPVIVASREGNQLVITWDFPSNVQLQSSTRLPATQWQAVTATPEQAGTRSTVRVPLTEGTQFFRLIGN